MSDTGNRLVEYLEASQRGGWGWKRRYEEALGESPPRLAGHYDGMLDELIAVIGGLARVLALLEEEPVPAPQTPPRPEAT